MRVGAFYVSLGLRIEVLLTEVDPFAVHLIIGSANSNTHLKQSLLLYLYTANKFLHRNHPSAPSSVVLLLPILTPLLPIPIGLPLFGVLASIISLVVLFSSLVSFFLLGHVFRLLCWSSWLSFWRGIISKCDRTLRDSLTLLVHDQC